MQGSHLSKPNWSQMAAVIKDYAAADEEVDDEIYDDDGDDDGDDDVFDCPAVGLCR